MHALLLVRIYVFTSLLIQILMTGTDTVVFGIRSVYVASALSPASFADEAMSRIFY